MENFLQIKTKDDFIIYGTLNSQIEKCNKLIIFVHGLSGNQHEHQYFNAVSFFNLKGFDTFRFDFYSGDKGSRQSSESSVSTHILDLNTVIDYFKDKYEKLYLVGHSLGCIVMMNGNLENIQKIIYWDPTFGFEKIEDQGVTYNLVLEKYIIHKGWEAIVSRQFVKEWQEPYNLNEYSKRLKGDCYFVFAGNCNKFERWKPFIESYPYEVVEGASHRFIEEGTLNDLYEKTLKFLE